MIRIIAYKIIYILFVVFNITKNIKVDFFSNISYKNIFNCKIVGTKKYPVIIKNSTIDSITAKEGSRLLNCTCGGKIELGRFVSISGNVRLSSRIYGIKIGSFTSIASGSVIQEDYHRTDKISTYYMSRNIFKDNISSDIMSKGKIEIEEDVWIGSNVIVLSGVKIGRGSIIGAGSIVTKNVSRYSVTAGNPAIEIKKRFSNEVIDMLEKSKWWNWDIEKIIKLKDLFDMNLNIQNNLSNLKKILKE